MSEGNAVLDEILADKPSGVTQETTTESTTTTEPTPEPKQDATGRLHGTDGKFTPKATEAAPAASATPPAAAPAEPQGDKTVPLSVLLAEREQGNKKLEEALREIQQLKGSVQALSARPAAQPAAPTPAPKKVELWDDPEQFVSQRIAEAITPVQQDALRRVHGISMRMATQAHGAETVKTAFQSMASALNGGDQQAALEYRRIMSSDHPYDELVTWHKQSQNLARIGSDPDAFIAAELEKKLSDPTFQAEFLKRIQAGAAAATSPTSQAPVNLPPTLSHLPSGANQPTGRDMSEEARFQRALA